jgi:hypothetical protein
VDIKAPVAARDETVSVVDRRTSHKKKPHPIGALSDSCKVYAAALSVLPSASARSQSSTSSPSSRPRSSYSSQARQRICSAIASAPVLPDDDDVFIGTRIHSSVTEFNSVRTICLCLVPLVNTAHALCRNPTCRYIFEVRFSPCYTKYLGLCF